MKSSMFLGALCTLGAVAQEVKNPSEVKPSYVTTWTTTTVTDWTTKTITETITVQPSSTAEPVSTTPSVPAAQVKVKEPAPSSVTQESSTSSAEPTTTQTSVQTEQPEQTTWSTSWEMTWTPTESSTQSTTQETAAPSSTQAEAPANAYQSTVLESHNVHRANHSANDLTWSADLAESARIMASQCIYDHNTDINGGGYGQNMGYGTSAENVGQMISNLMYNDEAGYFENLYGAPTPDMTLFDSWGHFTQIVWKASKEVGCATVTCNKLYQNGKPIDAPGPEPFTVCNYRPGGNSAGAYNVNVLRPLGKAFYSA